MEPRARKSKRCEVSCEVSVARSGTSDRRLKRQEMVQHFEKYLQTTLASIGDAVVSTDAKGLIVFANKVAESLLRATEADIVGRPVDEVFRMVNEFTRAKVDNPVSRVLREGAVIGLANHTVLIALDGSEIPIDDSAAPIRDDNGELQGAVLVFRDVTPRRQAEATRRLLASIVKSSDDAIISKDVRGVITSWNTGAERIFGYSAKEAIGQPISIIAAPDRIDEMPRILERIRKGERIDHFETVRRAKDGTLVNISLTVSPVHDAEGNIVGASKVARDITEQIRVRRELAEQRERLRVTLNSIGDAVITTDQDGMVTYLNPVAENLTGWRNADAAGKLLPEVFRIVNEQSRQTVENPAFRALREGKIVGLANHTVLMGRDGRELAIDDSAAPIRDEHGNIVGTVLTFRDVTERRAAESRLERQTAELLRTNDELNQFAYAVSHDLREPLRNIVNFSELLVREHNNRPGSEDETFTRFIVEGVHRMETLLDDLLAYSQMGGPQELPPRLLDTNEIVGKTLANLRATIAETGARITSDRLPSVVGYEVQLSQLFQNLIGNAVKYRSELPPEVHIGARRDGDEWIFSVRDNGIGIDPQYRKMIFGVFKRLHGRDIPGTGIGLAICSKVVERFGGRIWVESVPGEGSEFFFSVPIPGGIGPRDGF
jgi:PAS domain S-box-containing protein